MSLATLVVTPIDPSAGVDGALNSVTGAINSNQTEVMVVAGGLLAVTVLWRFLRRFVKP